MGEHVYINPHWHHRAQTAEARIKDLEAENKRLDALLNHGPGTVARIEDLEAGLSEQIEVSKREAQAALDAQAEVERLREAIDAHRRAIDEATRSGYWAKDRDDFDNDLYNRAALAEGAENEDG